MEPTGMATPGTVPRSALSLAAPAGGGRAALLGRCAWPCPLVEPVTADQQLQLAPSRLACAPSTLVACNIMHTSWVLASAQAHTIQDLRFRQVAMSYMERSSLVRCVHACCRHVTKNMLLHRKNKTHVDMPMHEGNLYQDENHQPEEVGLFARPSKA
eukprot:365578-Chlamydomonas_euryale.AAC.10